VKLYENCSTFRRLIFGDKDKVEIQEAKDVGKRAAEKIKDSLEDRTKQCNKLKKTCEFNKTLRKTSNNYRMGIFKYIVSSTIEGEYTPRDKKIREQVSIEYGGLGNYILMCEQNQKINCETMKLPSPNIILGIIEMIYHYQMKFDAAQGCLTGITNIAKKVYELKGDSHKTAIKKIIEYASSYLTAGIINYGKVAYNIYRFILIVSDILESIKDKVSIEANTKRLFGKLPFKLGTLFGMGIKIGVSLILGKRKMKLRRF
jgi:hypothetical protein